jgi:hypothetical protein
MADHDGRPLTPVQRSSSQAGQTSGTPQSLTPSPVMAIFPVSSARVGTGNPGEQ